MGQRLRAIADAGGGPASDGAIARTAVSGGELVPQELVTKLVTAAVNDAARSGHGIVLDGYPRDLEQMEHFENEVGMIISQPLTYPRQGPISCVYEMKKMAITSNYGWSLIEDDDPKLNFSNGWFQQTHIACIKQKE